MNIRARTIPLLGILLSLLLLAAACTNPGNVDNTGDWAVVKSPATGKCYEVLVQGLASQKILGMAPIDCSFLEVK